MHQPKQIAIAVSSHHTTLTEHLSALFDPAMFHVILYTTPQYLKLMKAEERRFLDRHHWVVSEGNESFGQFLYRHASAIDKMDLLILPTVRAEFGSLAKLPVKIPMMLFAHNLKYWTSFRQRLPAMAAPFWRQRLSLLKAHFINDDAERHALWKRADIINVHNPEMELWLRRAVSADLSKPVTTLPFAFASESESLMAKPDTSVLRRLFTFVIPGEIEPVRKNYFRLLSGFTQAARLGAAFRLVLLGPLKGSALFQNKIHEACDKLQKALDPSAGEVVVVSNSNVSLVGGMLPESVFRKWMKDADMLVQPMRPDRKKYFQGFAEQYGQTAASGFSFDALRFAKPVLADVQHELLTELIDSSVRYSSVNEMATAVLKLCQKPETMLDKKNAAVRISRDYQQPMVLQRFLNQLEEIHLIGR